MTKPNGKRDAINLTRIIKWCSRNHASYTMGRRKNNQWFLRITRGPNPDLVIFQGDGTHLDLVVQRGADAIRAFEATRYGYGDGEGVKIINRRTAG